jgi:hypothetical protein
MAHKILAAALSMSATMSPVSAAQPEPTMPAPPASEFAKYCLRVEPVTGSNVETIQCWTRGQWAEQDVDVDKVWAKEGVAVKG